MSSLRLVALFALFVAVIITASGSAIYLQYTQGRTADYVKRLRLQGELESRCWLERKTFCEGPNEANDQHLQYLNVAVYDARSGKLIRSLIDSAPLPLTKTLIDEGYEQTENYEAITLKPMPDRIFIVAGRNTYGLDRLERLGSIILYVSIAALLLVAAAGYVFSRLITRPLSRFNRQMQRITATNLTERLQLVPGREDLNTTASAFNEMLDRLQQAFEFQRSFVHHASHELRTPLASMLAHTESALGKDLTAAEAMKVLASLREDQRSMIDLTNSLLLLSQYEKMQASKEDWPVLRMDEIVMEVIEQFNNMKLGWQIRFEYEKLPESDADFSFHGNEPLIRSALRNLLKNAGHYSQSGIVSVTLKAAPGQCSVAFSNDGATLTDQEQQRLFIPFFRGANAMGKKGFGLGLSIVRRVMLIHFGDTRYSVNEQGQNVVEISVPTVESTPA